jgi:hypothetical protein
MATSALRGADDDQELRLSAFRFPFCLRSSLRAKRSNPVGQRDCFTGEQFEAPPGLLRRFAPRNDAFPRPSCHSSREIRVARTRLLASKRFPDAVQRDSGAPQIRDRLKF